MSVEGEMLLPGSTRAICLAFFSLFLAKQRLLRVARAFASTSLFYLFSALMETYSWREREGKP